MSSLEFLRDFALLVGPVSILLAALGLGALLAWPGLRRWRALGRAFVLSAASIAGLGAKVSGHNGYWLWGLRGWTGGTLISVGLDPTEAELWFNEVEDRGALGCRYCMPYESQARILVCRRPRIPVEELGRKARRFI